MEALPKEEEKKLCSSIEDAIKLTKEEDLSPNEAIQKVAMRDGYGPELINRMAQTFNKTKSMWRLKEANQDERVKKFSIADSDEIINKIYGQQKVASATPIAKAPSVEGWASAIYDDPKPLEKTASKREADTESGLSLLNSSASNMEPSKITPLREADHTRGIFDKMAGQAMEKKAKATLEIERALGRACETMRTMSSGQMQKVAQHLVNGYPESGAKLVALLSHTMGKEIPGVEKTASHTIFPTKEPYISIGNMYTACQNHRAAETEIDSLNKEAGALGDAAGKLLAYSAGKATSTAGHTPLVQAGASHNPLADYVNTSQRFSKSQKSLADSLSPSRYNRNKEINAKKNFYMSILYDKDLQDYNHSDLVVAYNDIVSMVPEAADSPALLRQLMRKHMESAGQMDTFELGQMATLSKTIADARLKRDTLETAKAEREKKQFTPPPTIEAPVKELKSDKGGKDGKSKELKENIKELKGQLSDQKDFITEAKKTIELLGNNSVPAKDDDKTKGFPT
jgi:hypothetical protein